MATKNVVKITIIGDDRSSGAYKSAASNATKFGDTTKRTMRESATVALGVYGPKAVAAVGSFFKAGIDGALEDERGQALLNRTLDKTTHATAKQKSQVDKWIESNQNATGTLDDELRPALDAMLRAGDSVAQAEKDVALAQDIATQTGKPLATVSAALAKAHNGQETALKKLDPRLGAIIKAGGSTDKIFGKLHKTFDGATKTFAGTGEGRMKVLSARLTDVKENIGAALLPILEKLGGFAANVLAPALAKVTSFLDKHKAAGTALAAVIGTLVAVLAVQKVATVASAAVSGIVTAATGAWTAAQWLLNAALTANPIGLIIAAVAAFVAGIVIAYTKVGWFRDLVNGAFKLIKGVIVGAFSWVRDHWPLLLAILTGPIGLATLFIHNHFDQIVGFVKAIPGRIAGAASSMFDAAKNAAAVAVQYIRDKWNGAVKFFTEIPGRIAAGIGSVVKTAVNGVIGLINSVINAINSFQIHMHIHIPHIPGTSIGGNVGFDWNGLNIPPIPTLHGGGIFNSGVGEGLAWLKDGEGVFTPRQMRAMHGGGTTIINLPAGISPSGVVQAQRAWQRRNSE